MLARPTAQHSALARPQTECSHCHRHGTEWDKQTPASLSAHGCTQLDRPDVRIMNADIWVLFITSSPGGEGGGEGADDTEGDDGAPLWARALGG